MGNVLEGKLRSFLFAALSLLLPVALVIAQEPTPLWTDTIKASEGIFAVNIDPETRTVNIMRTDDREGPSPHLRVLLQRSEGPDREIKLRALEKPFGPLRYVGQDKDWDGAMTGFRVEFSLDGKSWKCLAPKAKSLH